jgi:hypothetical protein
VNALIGGQQSLDVIQATRLYITFDLAVAAQTLDDTDHADRNFWAEATADWAWNGYGTVTANDYKAVGNLVTTWTGVGAGVFGPSSGQWSVLNAPTPVDTNGATANEAGMHSTWRESDNP